MIGNLWAGSPLDDRMRKDQAAKQVWIAYTVLLGLASGWLALLLVTPKLMCNGHEWGALLLYRAFALICHQRVERSFQWCGWPLAVCVRCTGIYAGGVLGLLLYPLMRCLAVPHSLARRSLLLALVLLAMDWGLGAAGVSVHNTGTRLVTGLAVGVVAVIYVLPALLTVLSQDRSAMQS